MRGGEHEPKHSAWTLAIFHGCQLASGRSPSQMIPWALALSHGCKSLKMAVAQGTLTCLLIIGCRVCHHVQDCQSVDTPPPHSRSLKSYMYCRPKLTEERLSTSKLLSIECNVT